MLLISTMLIAFTIIITKLEIKKKKKKKKNNAIAIKA